MNTRIWAVVALFGGVAVMLGVWAMMGTDSATHDAQLRAAKPVVPPPEAALGAQINRADVERISVGDVAARQRMISAVLDHGGHGPNTPSVGPTGVFALDQTGVTVAVQAHRADIDACYHAAQAHEPGLAAETTLQLSIVPDPKRAWGVVDQVSSDLGSAFDPCVSTVLGGLPFNTTEATTLRFPIQFGQ